MQALDMATLAGGGLVATGAALFLAAEPETPRALFAAAAALLCPLALVGISRRDA